MGWLLFKDSITKFAHCIFYTPRILKPNLLCGAQYVICEPAQNIHKMLMHPGKLRSLMTGNETRENFEFFLIVVMTIEVLNNMTYSN